MATSLRVRPSGKGPVDVQPGRTQGLPARSRPTTTLIGRHRRRPGLQRRSPDAALFDDSPHLAGQDRPTKSGAPHPRRGLPRSARRCSPAATRARGVTPLRLARVPRTEHAGRGSSFPLTGSGSRGGPRGVWSPRSAPLLRRVDWPSRTGEARSAVVHGQGFQSPADRRFYVMPVAERPAVSQGSQSVGTGWSSAWRRHPRDRRAAGGILSWLFLDSPWPVIRPST